MQTIYAVAFCLWAVSVAAEAHSPGRKIPGIVKPNNKGALINNNSSLGGSTPKNHNGAVNTNLLFSRQECPPGSELCPELFCCEDGTTCCPDGCCPDETPYCAGDDYCCEIAGQVACGDIDPTHCHDPGTTCCGAGISCGEGFDCCGTGCCPVGTDCCGGGACCDTVANDESSKCCPGDKNGPTCCGQYAVCCDGWCCYEGSTCSSEFGYCNIPKFDYAYDDNSTTRDFLRNACVGLQKQLALDRPDTTTQTQVLTYAGPKSGNRKKTDCKSSKKCCKGRSVPAGEPGAGDPMSCEEYPFNAVQEGGTNAQCSCISEYVNSAAGNQLGDLLNGMHKGFKFEFGITGVDCSQFTQADLYGCNS